MFEGLRKPKDLIVIVVKLVAYGCPIQAIVQAFGLDERTVASWRDRAELPFPNLARLRQLQQERRKELQHAL